MSKRVLLAGLGMQGQAALDDLASCGEFTSIVVADSRPDVEALAARYLGVKGVRVDVSDESQLGALMRAADIVVEALPATFALPVGQLAARCGVSIVSSMYYRHADRAVLDDLDRLAKDRDLTILTEFGMDPGLDLLMAAKAVSEFDAVQEFRTYGAGLPAGEARNNPLQYKFSWSPIGVMRSYCRPSTMIHEGRVLTIPADEIFEARNCHTVDVPELGSPLECFPNGDAVHYAELLGIRGSLRETGRYTGRYPGHCAFWNAVVKSGLLSDEASMEFMAARLAGQRQFQYAGDERDLSYIRVEARGVRKGQAAGRIYELLDYRDLATGFTAMQRTVGFTMSRGAQLIAAGKLKAGVLTPLDVAYDDVLPALERHGIRVEFQGQATQPLNYVPSGCPETQQ